MRTIALLAITGMIAAAEQPKSAPSQPAPAPRLNSAEIIAFQSIGKRKDELRRVFQDAQKEFQTLDQQEADVKADACKRALHLPACEVKQDGTLAPIEVKK